MSSIKTDNRPECSVFRIPLLRNNSVAPIIRTNIPTKDAIEPEMFIQSLVKLLRESLYDENEEPLALIVGETAKLSELGLSTTTS